MVVLSQESLWDSREKAPATRTPQPPPLAKCRPTSTIHAAVTRHNEGSPRLAVQADQLPDHLPRQTLPRQIADVVGLSCVGVGAPFQEEAGKGGRRQRCGGGEEAPVSAMGSSTLKRALVRPAVMTVTVPADVSLER